MISIARRTNEFSSIPRNSRSISGGLFLVGFLELEVWSQSTPSSGSPLLDVLYYAFTYPAGQIVDSIVFGNRQCAAAFSSRDRRALEYRVLAFYQAKIAFHVRDVLIQIDGREKLNDKLQQNENE